MFWENLVIGAADPATVGRFWHAALGAELLHELPEAYEMRLTYDGGPTLDVCVDRTRAPLTEPYRLHLDLRGGEPGRPEAQQETVDRLLGLGATLLDIGQGGVPWTVMGDPEGTPYCVMEHREVYSDTGPIAALPLDSSDPDRDLALWAYLTGWVVAPGVAAHSLRHPSMKGPLLELCREQAPKTQGRNRIHLDLRLEQGDDPDEIALGVLARGGHELEPETGWVRRQSFVDGSGNEFCLLPARP